MQSPAARPRRRASVINLLILWVFLTMPSLARADLNPADAAQCYNAIDRASAAMGTPKDVMLAISLTETGKKIGGHVQPWPWTVNMEGAGFWFPTRQEALAFVRKRFSQGARSFDVGCFQINYKWHSEHFRSIEDMFDPVINATYAARFLNTLFAEKGTWPGAAGAYHSRTPEFANRYAARFERHRARIAGGTQGAGEELGHGSEPIQLAANMPEPAPEIPREFHNIPVGRVTPTLSTGARPLGSLAAPGTPISSTGGLLRRTAGSLF